MDGFTAVLKGLPSPAAAPHHRSHSHVCCVPREPHNPRTTTLHSHVLRVPRKPHNQRTTPSIHVCCVCRATPQSTKDHPHINARCLRPSEGYVTHSVCPCP